MPTIGAATCSGSSIAVGRGGIGEFGGRGASGDGGDALVMWEGKSYLELVLLGLSSRAGVEEIDSENLG